MPFFQRKQPVVAAVVYDPQRGFLLTFNEKWRAYTLPMTRPKPADGTPARAAARAVAEAVGARLPGTTATPLEYLEIEGVSGRTGKRTKYLYEVFEVRLSPALEQAVAADPPTADPANAIPLPQGFGNRAGFLPYNQLMAADLVTWSTKEIVSELMHNQHVALAVISKPDPNNNGPLFLLTYNENYGGYFFPVKRIKTNITPTWALVRMLHGEDYNLPMQHPIRVKEGEVAADSHPSWRYGQQREYKFQVCGVRFPTIDLEIPGNPVEEALAADFPLWFSRTQLNSPEEHGLSPTVAVVRDAALRCTRVSVAGLALIRGRHDGQATWLAVWNEKWRALHFPGGHKEEDESYRSCVYREVAEELHLERDADFTVANQPEARLGFMRESRSAHEQTIYLMELFDVQLTSHTALQTIGNNREAHWLTGDEIRAGITNDGKRISDTMAFILNRAEIPF